MLKISRIILKILLCLSVVITLESLLMFLNQFVTTSEGVNAWGTPIALLLFGDGPYSYKELFGNFQTCSLFSLGFFIADKIFDIVVTIRHKSNGSD